MKAYQITLPTDFAVRKIKNETRPTHNLGDAIGFAAGAATLAVIVVCVVLGFSILGKLMDTPYPSAGEGGVQWEKK